MHAKAYLLENTRKQSQKEKWLKIVRIGLKYTEIAMEMRSESPVHHIYEKVWNWPYEQKKTDLVPASE